MLNPQVDSPYVPPEQLFTGERAAYCKTIMDSIDKVLIDTLKQEMSDPVMKVIVNRYGNKDIDGALQGVNQLTDDAQKQTILRRLTLQAALNNDMKSSWRFYGELLKTLPEDRGIDYLSYNSINLPNKSQDVKIKSVFTEDLIVNHALLSGSGFGEIMKLAPNNMSAEEPWNLLYDLTYVAAGKVSTDDILYYYKNYMDHYANDTSTSWDSSMFERRYTDIRNIADIDIVDNKVNDVVKMGDFFGSIKLNPPDDRQYVVASQASLSEEMYLRAVDYYIITKQDQLAMALLKYIHPESLNADQARFFSSKLYLVGEFDKAIQYSVNEDKSTNIDLRLNIANAYISANKNDLASSVIDNILSSDMKDSASEAQATKLASLYKQMGDDIKAAQAVALISSEHQSEVLKNLNIK
jgi:hypothetical protein